MIEELKTELETLKERATLLNITYHPNIGVDKLRAKVKEVMDKTAPEVKPAATGISAQAVFRNKLRKEANKLIRVRVACMNPNKKEWEGEVFTVSNSVVGTIRKFVPFNAEEGWYVPAMILTMMRERKCQIFQTVKGPRGNKTRKGKLIPEFSIETLENLTPKELKALAVKQAVANNNA